MFIPENVYVKFYKEDFEDIYPKAVELVKETSEFSGIIFH